MDEHLAVLRDSCCPTRFRRPAEYLSEDNKNLADGVQRLATHRPLKSTTPGDSHQFLPRTGSEAASGVIVHTDQGGSPAQLPSSRGGFSCDHRRDARWQCSGSTTEVSWRPSCSWSTCGRS